MEEKTNQTEIDMNWKKLKEFCNSLDEKQLLQNVLLWREDSVISKIEPMTLEEDHYIDPENAEDGCFSKSDAKDIVEDKDQYPNGMKHLKKVYDKGHPVLWEEF